MKRFLSWLAMIGCYIVFSFIVALDMALLNFIMDLYFQLSAFLKLVVLIIGGSFVCGIAFAPLWFGIPLTYSASEAVCSSKRGTRYLVLGIWILVCTIFEIIAGFRLRDILFAIYAIAIMIYGKSNSN